MQTVRLDDGLFQTSAPNGCTLLSEVLPGVRSAALGIWVRSASAHEARPTMGVSHLLEHMVFKGTERRTARQIALELEVRGGSLDAYTSRDHTSYQAHVLDADLPLAAEVLTDLVRRPLLREEDLELERNVVLEEISGVEDTPDDLVFELFARHALARAPLRLLDPRARAETVGALSAADLRAAHRRGYFRGNCVIAAAGHVDHQQLLTVLEREGWFEGGEHEAALPPAAAGAAARGVVRREARDTTQAHIVFGSDTFPYADPPPLRAGHAGQRLRRRDVEPALPADPRGARAGVRGVRLPAVLPVGRAGRRVRRHPAGHGGPGHRGHPGRVRPAGGDGPLGRGDGRRAAAAQGADHAVPREPPEPDEPAGLARCCRATAIVRSTASWRRSTRWAPTRWRRLRASSSPRSGRRSSGWGRPNHPTTLFKGLTMIIGVPKEIKTNENRIALVPAGAESLVAAGHTVYVEQGAGPGQRLPRRGLSPRSGAKILPTADEVWAKAEMIMKVKEPIAVEWPRMRKGQLIYTYFHFAAAEELTRAVIKSGAIAVAYETVQLPSGELPLLTPMSEVAGRMAVQEGAKYLEKVFGGSGILLGGVPGVAPGEVVIIGGGVVGINAAKMAAGLGAHVTILDISLDRLRYLDDVLPANVDTTYSNRHNILEAIRCADLVVGAVLLPGAKAPHLIKRADLQADEAGLGHRRRGGGPGRLRRDDQADDARGPDLLRGRHPALRRGQHAGRRAAHPHARAHQRHAALRAQAGQAGLEGGLQGGPLPAARPQRGRGQGGLSGRGGGVRAAAGGRRHPSCRHRALRPRDVRHMIG